MFGGLNFKLCFCQNGTGLPGNFFDSADFELNFMNFIISVPGKLYCILETVTNFPGPSQVTGPGGKIFIT